MNLYIHIPFCASKCSYCHFYSVVRDDLVSAYTQSLLTELNLKVPRNTVITTLYIGGGTPSLISPDIIHTIIGKLNLSAQAEITLECHPHTLTKSKIKAYFDMGINRLSVGIQSWNPEVINSMGRVFDPTQLKDSLHYAQSLGLTNINLDHIVAYPNQTDQILKNDINQSLSLNPTHISIYPLERHPGTKILKSPNTNKIIRQFSLVQTMLLKNGFTHYEELNFAKPNFFCQHNLDFWSGKDYIGLGPSAGSRIGNIVSENSSGISEYINLLNQHQLPLSQTIPLSSNQSKRLNKDLSNRLLITPASN